MQFIRDVLTLITKHGKRLVDALRIARRVVLL